MRLRSLALLLLVLAACDGVSSRLVAWKKQSYRDDARLAEKTVVVDGLDVHYLDRGGSGEPVVLIHGFGADKDNWTLAAKFLPDSYRVLALDLPGFGESARDPAKTYDVKSQAARVLAWADAIGLGAFHVAGNSMGGNIAARLALIAPQRVKSLALVDAAGVESPQPSDLAKELKAGRNPLLVKNADDYDRMMSFVFVKPPPIPGSIKEYLAERAVANAAFTEKIWGDIMKTPDRVEPELPKITARTLVLWGDTDRVISPSAAQVFANGIPGAQLVMMEKCGHAPMIERPEEFATKYLAFLAGK